jgi:hypothetical protein
MPYYVVNTRTRGGGASRGTHIMESRDQATPHFGLGDLLGFGTAVRSALCGMPAWRYVEVFEPSEASCRECRRRWEIATGNRTAPRKPPKSRAKPASARAPRPPRQPGRASTSDTRPANTGSAPPQPSAAYLRMLDQMREQRMRDGKQSDDDRRKP